MWGVLVLPQGYALTLCVGWVGLGEYDRRDAGGVCAYPACCVFALQAAGDGGSRGCRYVVGRVTYRVRVRDSERKGKAWEHRGYYWSGCDRDVGNVDVAAVLAV